MTQLLYLQDTHQFEGTAKIQSIEQTEKGAAIILDQTIFYPQGGGQPADSGYIENENGKFQVKDVRLNEHGVVYHFGEFIEGSFSENEEITMKVDAEKRIINARNHSAGHLLDVAREKANIAFLKPEKGYHFADGPYVEYDGELENPESYIKKMEEAINELVTENIPVEKLELSCEEANLKGIKAPPGKSARVIYFKGYTGCGCGGTHVNSSAEIGKVTIRKISSKKGKTKIAYSVE